MRIVRPSRSIHRRPRVSPTPCTLRRGSRIGAAVTRSCARSERSPAIHRASLRAHQPPPPQAPSHAATSIGERSSEYSRGTRSARAPAAHASARLPLHARQLRPYLGAAQLAYPLPEPAAPRVAAAHALAARDAAEHAGLIIRPPRNAPKSGARRRRSRRLRLAYLSSDLVDTHPVGQLMRAAFDLHDRKSFRVSCYATSAGDAHIAVTRGCEHTHAIFGDTE